MVKYGLNAFKTISDYTRKEVIIPAIMVGTVLLSGCSFDLMSKYNQLEKRENILESDLADVRAEKQKFVDGLAKIVQKIVASENKTSEEQRE